MINLTGGLWEFGADETIYRCACCNEVKRADEFPPETRERYPGQPGRKPVCLECHGKTAQARYEAVCADPEKVAKMRAITAQWRLDHPEETRVYSRRSRLKKYSMTEEEYQDLLAAQGGVCAICRESPSNGTRLHIDHDHACCDGDSSCGRCIRGLLCIGCNHGLGNFRDDPARLMTAADYVVATAAGL